MATDTLRQPKDLSLRSLVMVKSGMMITGFALIALACLCSTATSDDSFLVGKDVLWHYHASNEDPPPNWREQTFDTKNWPTGKAGFGFGDSDDLTSLTTMQGRFSRVQIRTDFQIPDTGTPDSLYLYINYDDGFVAHINGQEITRRNVAKANDGFASGNHEVRGYEEIEISNVKSLLRKGKNVLAVEGFNRSLSSSDFSLQALLSTDAEPKTVGWSVRVFPSGKTVPVFYRFVAPSSATKLSRERAIADVDELQRRIKDQSSYVQRNRFDLERAFEDLRQSIDSEPDVFDFGERLQQLIAKIGDCHARADVPQSDPRSRHLPFTIADTSDGVVALKVDRSALIDPQHPFVAALDGIPFDRWLDTAATFVPEGSPQLIRNRSLSTMRRIDQMRRHLNLPASNTIAVTLRSIDGSKTRDHKMQLASRASPSGRIPIARTRLLDGNIGYLRIEKMDNALEKAIAKQMKEFRDTNGLIIDVRDNGGGRYGLLRLMHGYLTPADSPPYVTNIAAYRKSVLFSHDHLHYRPTFREDDEGWNDRQRQAIRRASDRFQPEWTPPNDLFSQWHYMVIGKTPDAGQYHYDKPVVVLCNSGSFSATDGFLSCMADIPGVILLGEPSGGGSGSTQRFTLPASGIRIALSSMASFRPNGKLFDGNGVEVDIEMKPTIDDFRGKSDTVLDKAIELISSDPNGQDQTVQSTTQ